jgi:hypothetical protein
MGKTRSSAYQQAIFQQNQPAAMFFTDDVLIDALAFGVDPFNGASNPCTRLLEESRTQTHHEHLFLSARRCDDDLLSAISTDMPGRGSPNFLKRKASVWQPDL